MLKAIDGHFTIKFDVIGEQNVKTIGGIVSFVWGYDLQ